ncbi:peptidoglycan DD-metalloendopeptidase family protein, partial [Patescibacteria group bacterium]|nr:peptidoglycan DD-metalloendopeptidase family protein [Patescibacteria group bacterium]
SGYSTGCHLHFEIRNKSKGHVNPNSYINNGYFIHPVPGVRVSAPYGYSSAYFGGVFHTGIDYADGCASTPIRAVADGEIVLRVSGRPNTFPWSYEYGNYVMIRHTNGMYSLYAHLR